MQASLDNPWFVVHTRPRQESTAERHLERQGFRCYLPRASNPDRRMGGNGRVCPVFPRYLFLQADAGRQSLAPVNSTRGVARLVRFGERLARAPDGVIDSLRSATDAATGLVRLEPAAFAPGDPVQVFQGPLAGLKAIFRAADGESRALLLVSLLGRQSEMTVPAACLRAAR
ncbi:MAG: transcription termination/antitermination NusG family protein [Xanthomonadales bacterium]|nr:transcription termination/antitermination NusG family protein [Xanthomonadales bacterium]